jgi:hypothetical protein
VAVSEREILGETENVERALASVDAAKRETLRKLILGAAFVVPVVASFSINGLTLSKAQASYAIYYSGRSPNTHSPNTHTPNTNTPNTNTPNTHTPNTNTPNTNTPNTNTPNTNSPNTNSPNTNN